VAFGLAAAMAAGGCGSDSPNGPQPQGGQVVALNGVRFQGFMGSDSTTTAAQFAVTDAGGNRLANHQIQVAPVRGDGAAPRSIATDAAGVAVLQYDFSGRMGHAALRLYAEGTDTLEVYFRADAIIPGVHGQVGYVLFDDDYAEVKRWLGQPESEDVLPNRSPVYASWESTRGLVVMLYDWDLDGKLYDSSSVYGAIAVTGFAGTTPDGDAVGMGSTIAEVRKRFGPPTDWGVYPEEPNTLQYYFGLWDLYVFADGSQPDTPAVQMTLGEYIPAFPTEIVPLNGLLYRVANLPGGMTYPALQFAVEDSSGARIGNVDIQLSHAAGAGSFLSTGGGSISYVTTATTPPGLAEFRYLMTPGLSGSAVGRLTIPVIDTLDIYLRRNVLAPGSGGQGQYVLFNETYAEAAAWNGTAASVAGDGRFGPTYAYAAYPDSGLTFVFRDPGGTNQVTSSSQVYGVIAEAPWPGTMASASAAQRGIRIGSTYAEVTGAYGAPSSSATAGDTLGLVYDGYPVRFELVPAVDGAVVRILTWEGP